MDLSILSRAQSHAADLNKLADEASNAFDSVVQRVTAHSPTRQQQQHQQRKLDNTQDNVQPKLNTRIPKVLSSPNVVMSTIPEEDNEDESTHQHQNNKTMNLPPPIPRTPSLIDLLNLSSRERDEFKAKQHYDDLFGAFSRNFAKGFLLGFSGRVFLNVLIELVAILKRGRKNAFMEVAIDGARDHGIFFGLLLAVHNSIMFATKLIPLDGRLARYRGAIAAFIAGCSSLWTLPPGPRRSIVLFTLVRSIEVAARIGVRSGRIRNFNDGDTLLMSISSAVMIWIYVFYPKCLDQSYVHFLNRHAQFPPLFVQGVGLMQSGLPLQNLKEINEIRNKLALPGTPPKPITNPLAYDDPSLSATEKAKLLLHPTRPFPLFAILFFLRGFFLAVPVYGPVFAIPLLLFRRAKLLRDPIGVGKSEILSVARSSGFLSLYCTLGIAGLSLGRQMGIRYDVIGSWAKLLPAISGFMGGLATMLEKKPRRIELALYVSSKAVEGIHNLMIEKFGSVAQLPGSDVLVFSIALAIILHGNLRYPPKEEIVQIPTNTNNESNNNNNLVAAHHKSVRTHGVVRDIYRDYLLRFFDTDSRHSFFLQQQQQQQQNRDERHG
jgi:hypothetical protein